MTQMTRPAAPPAPSVGLIARLFPPLTPAQAELLARIKFPCC
jgi:hypothetical protein